MKKFLGALLGVLSVLCVSLPANAQAIDPVARGLAARALKPGVSASCGTVTVSTPCLDLTQTWNNVATTFTGVKLNVTDTASASGSLLLDLQVGSTSQFRVIKSGSVEMNGDFRLRANSSVLQFGSSSDVSLARDAANTLALRNGTSAQTSRVFNTYTDSSNGEWFQIDWTTQANLVTLKATNNGTGAQRGMALQASDLQIWTGATRRWNFDGSGNFVTNLDNAYDIGASGATRPRSIFVGTNVTAGGQVTAATIASTGAVVTGVGTVSGAGTCNGGVQGSRRTVTDATVAASGNFGATVTGGGANIVPIYCDGTNWRIG